MRPLASADRNPNDFKLEMRKKKYHAKAQRRKGRTEEDDRKIRDRKIA